MGMMERMMDFMMGRMSEGEKKEMMNQMMDNFFAEMTVEDKKEMMAEMMPRMMEGINMMEMMPNMMPGGKEMRIPMMPAMMMEMMPQCLTMIFPNMPEEKRIDFILKMVGTLMEQGRVGLSKEEESAFTEKVVEKVKA